MNYEGENGSTLVGGGEPLELGLAFLFLVFISQQVPFLYSRLLL